MTDNEIIKALECCKTWNCEKCINRNRAKTATNCRNELVSEIFDLINRQKGEIERLQSMNQAKLDMIHDIRAELETAKSEAIREFAVTLISKINELDVYSCDIGYGNTDRGYLASEVISTVTNSIKEMTEGDK